MKYEGISKTDYLWDAKLSKNIIWRSMKCLVFKMDNYGKDVETIRLQKVHINQLLTFQRNYKQVAKGTTVKAKEKTPMTAKDGNENYPEGRSNEETVCVRTLKTILRAQKIEFPSDCTSIRVLLKLLKDKNSNFEPNRKKIKNSFQEGERIVIIPKVLDLLDTSTVPSFKPVVYNDRERLLFDTYLHKWCILYLLVLFLLVHLSGLCELHVTGTIASLVTDCIYVMESVHTAKVHDGRSSSSAYTLDASYNLDRFFFGLLCYACQMQH